MNDRVSILLLGLLGMVLPGYLAFQTAWNACETSVQADESKPDTPKQRDDLSRTLAEARGRARLLHETLHGALQVMHRDFFREDEGLAIPSRSLEDVFRELHRSHQVTVRWLAVNAEPMNIAHKPQDAFEKSAVQALASGRQEFDELEGNTFSFAGLIRLPSQCLKCHVPGRTDTKDRAAAVVIRMPINDE